MYMYRYEKRVKYYGHIENNDGISECCIFPEEINRGSEMVYYI